MSQSAKEMGYKKNIICYAFDIFCMYLLSSFTRLLYLWLVAVIQKVWKQECIYNKTCKNKSMMIWTNAIYTSTNEVSILITY